MAADDLIVRLRNPFTLARADSGLNENGRQAYYLHSEALLTGESVWVGLPDFIVGTNNVLNGLCFFVHHAAVRAVHRAIGQWDPNVVHIVDTSKREERERYANAHEGLYLEVTWRPAGAFLMAQLDFSEACWLWSVADSQAPYGLVLFDVEELLRDHGITRA